MNLTLHEVIAPLLSYGLLYEETPSARQRPFTELRDSLLKLVERQRALTSAQHMSADDYALAEFAVVAWLDERISACAEQDGDEGLAEAWKREPLQSCLYCTLKAGDEVFVKLNQLRPDQSAVREIYYLCLRLGFRGKHGKDKVGILPR